MRLEGKVAIVTGAAKGLGRAFAIGLAAEGARVMLVTRKDVENLRKTAEAVEAAGGEADTFRADVSRKQEADAIAEATVRRFGKVDILVNNAAVYEGLKRKPFHEIDISEWDLVMAVNAKGTYLCIRAVFPYMKDQGYGKIVNLASEVFFTGSRGFVHYVASKGAVIGLTRALAVELGPYNIRINCIAPGFTDTEASRALSDVSRYDTSRTPLGRVGRPEDLTGAVIFLASAQSDFITGQTLVVNGGRIMH